MLQILRFSSVALLAVVLVGCATSKAIPLKPEASARIQSTRALIVIPQNEVNAEVVRSNVGQSAAASGGVLGALIGSAIDASLESSRASKANLALEPVRQQLVDFDFRAECEKKFRTAMVSHPWLKVDQIDITGQPDSPEDPNRTLATVPQDSLLAMVIDYQLSSDFRSLIVRSTVSFWQRGLEDVQYLGEYRYLSAPIRPKSGETAVKVWADNNARLLRAAMHEGIDETIRMLKLDFVPRTETGQEDAPLGAVGKVRVVSIKLGHGVYKGGVTTSRVEELADKILATDSDRVIFRSKYLNRYTYPGHIYSTTTLERFEIPAAAAP